MKLCFAALQSGPKMCLTTSVKAVNKSFGFDCESVPAHFHWRSRHVEMPKAKIAMN
jgi:hypothetical protein